MNQLFKMLCTVCAFTYLISIIVDITNIDSNKRIVQLVLTLYFISVLISPIYTFDFEEINYDNTNTYQFYSQDYFQRQLKETVENDISSKLKSENIYYKEVDVHIFNSESEIKVDNISITGISDSDRHIVISLLDDYTHNIYFGD